MRMFLQMWRSLRDSVASSGARWRAPAINILRWATPVALLAYLGHGLTRLGWGHVWDARPLALSFYLVQLPSFFVQPIADLIIYHNLLGVGRALPLLVFLRKRYLNSVMLEYSGEAYFFFWARQNLKLKKGILLHAVKDSNVLSGGAGLAMVWLVMLALIEGGGMKMPAFLATNFWTLISIGSLPLVLCIGLIIGGQKVTTLSRREIATTFSIHLARSIMALSFDFAIWWLSGALPSGAVCLEFVGLRLLVTRLPLVPSKDLLFIGIGMTAAGLMDLSAPRVAAVLVITTAVEQLMEFVLVGLPWLCDRFWPRPTAGSARP